MTRVGRARMRTIPIALALALVLCTAASSVGAILRQESPTVVEVAAGPIREQSLALVGRAVYGADAVSVFGYFTAIEGIDPALLTTSAPLSETTARFTYAGEIALTSRADRGDVTIISGEGTIRVYLSDTAGATWDDPASFAAGEQLAEWNALLRETLHRQAPGVGLVVGDDRLRQATGEEFSLADEIYRFGGPGIAQRLRTIGAIITSDPAEAAYTVSLSGSAAVSERPATPVQLGLPATPEVSASTLADECTALLQWMSETSTRLATADELTAPFALPGTAGNVDVEAARAAADEIAPLAAAQRTSAVPAGGEEANRLAVTALSTYARGLQTVKDGAASGDTALLAQGQAVAADGGRLGGRARDALYILDAACPQTG